MEYPIVAVDLQKDFWVSGGKAYTPKPCVEFLSKTMFPFLRARSIKVHEIISDYRPPRPGDRGDLCYPGSWGYESLVSDDLRASQLIKCMNSPLWTRVNIGRSDREPGTPYCQPMFFDLWLLEYIGRNKPKDQVRPVLIGLTVDCCVLCTAQDLNFRGFYPLVLREGVDHATGRIEDRDQILRTPMPNWAEVIGWDALKGKLVG